MLDRPPSIKGRAIPTTSIQKSSEASPPVWEQIGLKTFIRRRRGLATDKG